MRGPRPYDDARGTATLRILAIRDSLERRATVRRATARLVRGNSLPACAAMRFSHARTEERRWRIAPNFPAFAPDAAAIHNQSICTKS